MPHRRAQLLLPGLRQRAAPGRCDAGRGRPALDEFLALAARPHGRAGVARGARRPRDAGLGVREARRRPATASCSSRSSTPSAGAGSRSSAATRRSRWSCAAARSRSTARRRPACPPTPARSRRSRALLAGYRAPRLAEPAAVPRWRRRLPRLRRRARDRAAAATSRDDRSGCPTRCCSLTGHVTAFDHFRQRLYLIENVFLDPTRPTPTLDAAYADAVARLDDLAARAGAAAAVLPSPPPASDLAELPASTSTMQPAVPARGGGGAGSTSSPATSSRWCSRSASTSTATRPVRRVPRAAPGEPVAVHVLPAPRARRRSSARRPSRWCSCSTAG